MCVCVCGGEGFKPRGRWEGGSMVYGNFQEEVLEYCLNVLNYICEKNLRKQHGYKRLMLFRGICRRLT